MIFLISNKKRPLRIAKKSKIDGRSSKDKIYVDLIEKDLLRGKK
ncbi:3127_t:CDS:2 [Rhizophagus irregularis]|nr:3127_t:CDS:2 [Rhizophagus irregularis]